MKEEKFPRPERAAQNDLILFLDCPHRANAIGDTMTVGARTRVAHGYYGSGLWPGVIVIQSSGYFSRRTTSHIVSNYLYFFGGVLSRAVPVVSMLP